MAYLSLSATHVAWCQLRPETKWHAKPATSWLVPTLYQGIMSEFVEGVRGVVRVHASASIISERLAPRADGTVDHPWPNGAHLIAADEEWAGRAVLRAANRLLPGRPA